MALLYNKLNTRNVIFPFEINNKINNQIVADVSLNVNIDKNRYLF